MWVYILKECAVREVEQPLLFPVFLVPWHLSFQQGLQMPAHGAVEGSKVPSQEVPAETIGERVQRRKGQLLYNQGDSC